MPARGDLRSRCHSARAPVRTASRAVGSSMSAPSAAVGAQLVERIRAPRGVEEVGGHQRVVGQVGRHERPSALASCTTTGRSPQRLGQLLGPLAVPAQHVPSPAVTAKRHEPSANSWPSACSGARTATDSSPAARPATCVQLAGAHPGGQLARAPTAGARPRRRRPAPPPGGAAGRAARTRGTPRAVASDRAPARPRRSTSTPVSRSRRRVASCLEMRAASACSVRFCLRLAPEISSIEASTPSRSPKRWSRSDAVLSPMPGNAGDVVGGVPLEPVEVGDQLGRDAVAVDHRLAVVDLGLGDAARGGHHLARRPSSISWKASRSPVTIITGMPCSRGLLGQRGDHVVGLEPVDRQVAVAEGVDQRLQVRPLLGSRSGRVARCAL